MFQFKNIKEFAAYFSDERTCWDYLEKKCWKGEPVCPHCGSKKVYRTANYKMFKCGNKKGCNRKFTVLVGTVMENTKLPLSTWFLAIYLTTQHKKGISSLQLARDLGVTQRTSWFLLHRIREMVKPHSEIALSGQVQTDETYVKGLPSNRVRKQRIAIWKGERKDEAATIIGMVETDGRAVFKHVKNAHHHHVYPVMYQTIQDKQTVLVTDAHRIYNTIGEDYAAHIQLNHAHGEYFKDGFHTNSVEGAFSWFKKTIFGTYHWVSFKHMQKYCTMFSYRYSTRRFSEPLRFDTTMAQVKGRLTYNKLIS